MILTGLMGSVRVDAHYLADSVRQQAKADAANDGAALTGDDEQSGRGRRSSLGPGHLSVDFADGRLAAERPCMTSRKYAVSTAGFQPDQAGLR